MAIESWQKVDEDSSHCGECNDIYRNVLLTKGLCPACLEASRDKSAKLLARSQTRVVSKATKSAANLLAALQDQGKTGASLPKAFESFWGTIGGEEEYGNLMALEFKKSLGEGITDEDIAGGYEASPKMRLQWFEMINRHGSKVDEGKQLDVGSLDEADLETILADIARNAVLTDPELRRLALTTAIDSDPGFRRIAFQRAAQADPKLAEELLEANGVVTVPGEVVVPKKHSAINNTVDDLDDDYDPTEDEYKAE